MSTSPAIAALTEALDQTRNELTQVVARIDALEGDRQSVVAAPPHTSDIVAVILRGLAAEAGTFKREFASRLIDEYTGAGSAAAVAASASPSLLRLEAKRPSSEEAMSRHMKGMLAPELNIGVLAYFMHDKIADEIPALVDQLCPAARDGMPKADRAKRLEEIDRDLAELRSERERLQADLNAVRATFSR